MEDWIENPLYKPKDIEQNEEGVQAQTKLVHLPNIPEQVLIEAEARFPNLDTIDSLKTDDIQVPDIIYYEPYILRFDQQK